ncbi:type I-B CRISPR-associated endonuclease Cas1b [Thermus filiformis]|uniref:CRISPR-associated endonuclease Cas1 n=1 Tax=Thermus filiformis TaxID=276 RepID=A0A0A2XCI5_THEFI|nr:type I-B CRISPR-associated endonuclease Cas1b [Thermus filiformis]KGQ22889.2 CRISPR-associated protein Cas1 [Thermus filiformis]
MPKPVYVFSSGRLGRLANTIVLETEERKRHLPVEQVSELYLFGEVDLNKRFLEFAAQKGILLHFFNRFGYYVGSFYPREHLLSGYLTLRQAEHYLDPRRRLDLARRFVAGGLENLRRLLQKEAAKGKRVEGVLELLEKLLPQVDEAQSVGELMALEGRAREAYYGAWEELLGQDWSLERSRRPPKDPINALLSFGNSLLYTALLAQIYQTHLDPRIGFLHEANYRRHSLNLDVAEVFKPPLVDRLLFRLVRRGQVKAGHFLREGEGVFLSEAGRRLVVEEWEKTLQATYRHPSLRRSVSYRTTLRLELYKLEKHLMGETPYAPYRMR